MVFQITFKNEKIQKAKCCGKREREYIVLKSASLETGENFE